LLIDWFSIIYYPVFEAGLTCMTRPSDLFGYAPRRNNGCADDADDADSRGFWWPAGHLHWIFDYDFSMIYMMAIIALDVNHGQQINHSPTSGRQATKNPRQSA
jgi:hypothetical protein